MAREVEDVELLNRQRLAVGELLRSITSAVPKPAPGTLIRIEEDGSIMTNRGIEIRKGTKKSRG